MRQSLLYLALFSIICLSSYAESRKVIVTKNCLTINYDFEKIDFRVGNNANELLPAIEGFGTTNDIGRPALPRKIETFLVPDGHAIQSITYHHLITDTIDAKVISIPCPISENNISGCPTATPIEQSTGLWPKDFVRNAGNGIYRDLNIGFIEITPILYDYESKQLIYTRNLEVTVNFKEVDLEEYKIISSQNNSIKHVVSERDISSILSIRDSTQDFSLSKTPLKNQEIRVPHYLIIAPEDFEGPANRLASWKRRMGFETDVIVASREFLQTPNNTKTYIQKRYMIDPDLEYVLLLGGGEQIRPFLGKFPYLNNQYYTDHYFACLDGENDLIEDIKIGRLPAQNLEEAEIMVNKTIRYEYQPPLNYDRYFTEASHIAYFEAENLQNPTQAKQRFVLTSEDVLNYVATKNKSVDRIYFAYGHISPEQWSSNFSDGSQLPDFLMKPNFSWDSDTNDIINAFNEGKSYILYRGHGIVQGLKDIIFANKHVNQLTNKDKLPIFFGITCNVGTFYNDNSHPNGTHSLSETLLAYPNGGAVGIIAANQVAYSAETDHFTGGIFSTLYPDPGLVIDANLYGTSYPDTVNSGDYSLGNMLASGGRRMFQGAGVAQGENKISQTRYVREIFHCLGDPSIQVYKTKPINNKPNFLCEGGSNIYFDYQRDVVFVNKRTNHVSKIAHPFRLSLEDYMDDYWISIIGNNNVPILLNTQQNEENKVTPHISCIEASANDITIYIDNCTNESQKLSVYSYDIYGQLSDIDIVVNGTAKLVKSPGFHYIVLKQEDIIIETRSIMN